MAAGFTSGQYVAMEKPSSVEVLAASQYVKAVQKATGMQPAGQRAGNRNLYAQGHVLQVDAVAEQMRGVDVWGVCLFYSWAHNR